MIITLIFITMLILGIALGALIYKDWAPEWFDWGSFALALVGVAGTIGCVILIIVNLCYVNIDYEDKVAERQMLEYRIENYEDAVGNELLYDDIVEFNKDLRHTKRFYNSPWTNWFNNWKVAEIDYIGIEELNQKGE